jgi:putative exporter of polyketide antibiotics
MSEPSKSGYRTGWLWGVLTILLLIGTVAAAFVVYGLTDLFATGNWALDVPAFVGGGVVASIAMLLLTGILYRVDRLRGVPHREVRLFE